ncbi:MAG: hypothetical protein LUF92_16890 [Clostridiales bacterium]|nr:hypothetical protein [Clostridiales bacterium]
MVKTIIRNVIIVLLFLLAGSAIVYLLIAEKEDETQAKTAEEVVEEAKPYEDELKELESELKALKNGVSYSSEKAQIMIGFVVEDASDLTYIKEKADACQLSPILVLDCTMERDVLEEIIEEADESWEIMLYAAPFSEETNEDVLSVISYLKSEDREYSDVFFLRSDYNNEDNLKRLKRDGFSGYTSYHSNDPVSGQTEDGTVYFDYSYLSSSGISVSSRISALYGNKAAMIIAFSMTSINNESMSDTYVESTLENIRQYTANSDCAFSTIKKVVKELSSINDIEAENQSDYEEKSKIIQEQIDELEETIEEIYDQLEY